MPTAKKLPSGSWRVRVFSHTEIIDGKKVRKYESFTSSDPSRRGKMEAEQKALEWCVTKENRRDDISLYEATEGYIRMRTGVLSPYTIRGYKSMLRTHFVEFGAKPLHSIKRADAELWISSLSAELSPKTVRNIAGLFSAVYKEYVGKSMVLRLPQSEKPKLHTPTDDEVKRLLEHTRGTDLEIAIALAAFCSLRRGEICALTRKDFHDGMVYVTKAAVRSTSGEWDEKAPKTPASTRAVPVPDEIMKMIERKEDLIVSCNPDALASRFKRAVKFSHLEHPFRFHDLRHYYASTAHYLGMPDAYIKKNGGWATDSALKRVYMEALEDKQKTENTRMAKHFKRLYDTKYATKRRSKRSA